MSPLTCRHRKRETTIIDTRQPREDDPDRTHVKYQEKCLDCKRVLRTWWQ